jgi:hypothetical protein
MKRIEPVICSFTILEFCDFLIKDVVEQIACRYQYNQHRCPLDAGLLTKITIKQSMCKTN